VLRRWVVRDDGGLVLDALMVGTTLADRLKLRIGNNVVLLRGMGVSRMLGRTSALRLRPEIVTSLPPT
jgi:hypothetical protein